jgi:hypothetical protein
MKRAASALALIVRGIVPGIGLGIVLGIGLGIAPGARSFAGAPATTFTYQGRLMDGAVPADGTYAMEFSLWDAPSDGNLEGGPVFQNVGVSDGLFTTLLDFGVEAFNNEARWLEIEVDGVLLTPRQLISRTPYAMQTRGIFADADDRIGIGTIVPSAEAELHVQANTVDNFAVLCDSLSVSGSEIGLHTGPAMFASLAKNTYFTAGWFRFNENRGAFLQEIEPDGDVRLDVAAPGLGLISWNTAMFLEADGDVGLGTTAPTARLEVVTTDNQTPIVAQSSGTDFSSTAIHGIHTGAGLAAGNGVFGQHLTDGTGVVGSSAQGVGVFGIGGFAGIWGQGGGPGSWAGYFIGDGHFSQRLLVGRETPININEYFGVESPAESGYGGMFISTAGADGSPFYGYSAGGGADMWTYYNGTTGDWNVNNAGDRLTVESNGEVGIGTASPGFLLHVDGSAGKPGGGTWSVASDTRLKKNIASLHGSLDQLLALRGVSFQYIDPDSINELPGQRIGMIAQEVEHVFPDWVDTRDDGYKTITFRGFEALTVEALRDLREEKDAEINLLRVENESLRQRLATLEELVDRLALHVGAQAEIQSLGQGAEQ